jgi:hypothetical protein
MPSLKLRVRIYLAAGVAIVCAAFVAHAGQGDVSVPSSSNGATYTSDGSLEFPKQTEHWTTLGASIGGRYAEGAFDPKNPGTINLVQIDPDAYPALRETGHYPDGTMLLLTFYDARSKTDPQLKGFIQGDLQAREIHVLDRKRFPEEGGAFFLFSGTDPKVGVRQAVGSACFQCHTQHGKLDATFAQFYPSIRDLARK